MSGERAQVPSPSRRMAWLDAARGVALIAMASYHLMWDLSDFGYLDAAYPSTGWPRIYARSIASTFLFLAGFSLMLSHRDHIRWRSFAVRQSRIIAAAIAITVATYFAMPRGYIFFGILHSIAVASLVGLAFRRVPSIITAAIAVAAIVAPLYLKSDVFNPPWLWWVGLSTQVRNSFDYVPLLPWLGPFLLGIATAKPDWMRRRLRQDAQGKTGPNRLSRLTAYLGRHSLVFYLVHQPVLISIVFVVSLIAPPPVVSPATRYIGNCESDCSTERTAEFCQPFCACTLKQLQDRALFDRFQSGAMSEADSDDVRDIAIECTGSSR